MVFAMGEKELISLVRDAPKVLEQVYTDLAQPSVRAVGQALGTVFEFSTSMLLPVKLLNEKFKLNFTKRLNEYKEKLESIPEEKRCEVHPQIGTPIVERLTYTTTDEIADLFTTLLTNASNVDRANLTHPSFIGIIEHLSTDEARIIKYLKGKTVIEYCDFEAQLNSPERGHIVIVPRATLIPRDVKLNFKSNIGAYLSNLESCGVLVDKVGTHKVDTSVTDEICREYNLEQIRKDLVPSRFKSIDVTRCFLEVTPFGKMFIDACLAY